ncbi:hypothetical protein GIB67_005019 [Kingdonia uniflora]|uniref:Ubiquitin fusion degradation protein UFD1 N-terminal subdomain 2 domain-containing protein n=1 Tax=Kingdonia uniflora TaxID=39325 RepID=A0A7J7NMM6_9MAGN|nr:hypothetical protein GIB67_005019 [Kingdonia uniflora]
MTTNCFLFSFLFCTLKTKLRNSSCLTTGDSIMVTYNNKKYCIDIVESKPAHAISIIETVCEVDFAPPLDYKEPERPAASVVSSKEPAQEYFLAMQIPAKETKQEQLEKKEEPKFQAFSGKKYTLKGLADI